MSRFLAVAVYILISRLRTAVPRPEPVSAGLATEVWQEASARQPIPPIPLNQVWEKYGRPGRYTIESGGTQTGWHVFLPHQPDRL